MAWRRLGTKPLSEPVIAQSTDVYVRHTASVNYGQCRNADADVFIHFYTLVCLNIQTFYEFYLYTITVMFLLFYSGYFVFILCIH